MFKQGSMVIYFLFWSILGWNMFRFALFYFFCPENIGENVRVVLGNRNQPYAQWDAVSDVTSTRNLTLLTYALIKLNVGFREHKLC